MSKKRKWVKYGWIGKTDNRGCVIGDEGELIVAVAKRGKRDDWGEDFWPPRKVRVTVEEV